MVISAAYVADQVRKAGGGPFGSVRFCFILKHATSKPTPNLTPTLAAEPSLKAEPESCPEISAFEPWRSGCETITCEIMDDPQEDAFLKEVKDDEAGQTMLLLCKKSTCVDVYVCVCVRVLQMCTAEFFP